MRHFVEVVIVAVLFTKCSRDRSELETNPEHHSGKAFHTLMIINLIIE